MTIGAFLQAAGWADATTEPLAGDASTRRYTRLTRGAQSAILMDAPVATPADRASYSAFRTIGAHLKGLALSAPKEICADPDNGLILMEDLGDMTLSKLLRKDSETARTAYRATAALLPRLHANPPQGLAQPTTDAMAQMVEITFEFVPNSGALRTSLTANLSEALTTHAAGSAVLSLRDVHADNLLWLPEREGDARIGLLDFQDALLLPEGYDLASLLDDPRREVPEAWREDLIAAHSAPPRVAVLSLQRNLRILGIFRRLSTDLGKPSYAAFLPRTRSLIARAVEDVPSLKSPVVELLDRTEFWAAP